MALLVAPVLVTSTRTFARGSLRLLPDYNRACTAMGPAFDRHTG